ncbi:DUF397 domain-containing protein [Micromonospora coxensis]|uniref:DUF397 domain-containing protein n=1 Tax=Micromonospora coxensis TaxID=356852 RepID=UPI00341D8F27
MEEVNQAAVTWRKSTRSNGSGNCVEVADNLPGKIRVRDSKEIGGPILCFGPSAWSSFISGVQKRTLTP